MQKVTVVMVGLISVVALGSLIWFSQHNAQKLPGNVITGVTIDMDDAAKKENIVPIVIIGSGCAGLSAAVYGARSNTKTLVISGNEPGGQLTETTYVENWPGSVKELGADLIEKLKTQAKHFGAEFIHDAVESIDFSTWPYHIHTEEGKKINALSIIIATGASPRKLGVPGEKEYWGNGVTTCAICDAPFHKGNDVVVIGGGDSAAEEAIQLSAYAKNVTLLVRKDSMRAAASMQARLAKIANIHIQYSSYVDSILGDGKKVTGVIVHNAVDDSTQTVSVSGVFLAIGHIPNTALFKDALTLDEQGYIVLQQRSQKTLLPGVFAAGDVEDHVYRQAGVASGSGIKAALDATAFLQEHGLNATVIKKMDAHFFEPVQAGMVTIEEVEDLPTLQALFAQHKKPIMVDFYTPHCTSCIQMMPALESVAYNLGDKMLFVKVDASKALDIITEYHVAKVPCLIIFQQGGLVARVNNALSKKELYEFVHKVI